MLVGDNFNENFAAIATVGISKTIYRAVSLREFINYYWKSHQFVRIKSTRPLSFWRNKKTKRVNSYLTNCSQKRKKNETNILRKNPRKWNYEWNSVLKTCTELIVGIFERTYTYPISSNFCEKNYLQYYWLYNFPYYRSSHSGCVL